jgi:hypothetical protein
MEDDSGGITSMAASIIQFKNDRINYKRRINKFKAELAIAIRLIY